MDFSQSNERSNKKIVMEASTYLRPSWDEYFLGLMEEVGKRQSVTADGAAALWCVENKSSAPGMWVPLPGFPIVTMKGIY